MDNMRIAAVSDHFMCEEYYRACFDKHPSLTVTSIPYWGAHDRAEMRAMVDKLEKEGAYAFPPPNEIYSAVKDAELLMVHLCPVTEAVLKAAPKLRYILSNRGGLENIDLAACKRRHIPILHNPAHNGNAVAELTVGLMICETRNVARADRALREGVWREQWPNVGRVFELRHKTIGIIGFGTIGRLVAEKLQPFHVQLLACDPNISPDDADLKRFKVTLTTQEELLRNSDIVTLHARSEKRELIMDAASFALMKPTATFINTARAYMVDYAALEQVLREDRITGAALEVFPEEPLPADSPFIKMDNVTLTNHRGGDTVNCYSDSPDDLLTALEKYLDEGIKPRFFIE